MTEPTDPRLAMELQRLRRSYMTFIRTTLFLPAFLVTLAASAQTTPSIAGTWLGTLEVGVAELRLVFNVTEAEDETLAATIDSPDQGANGIPVNTVLVEGDSVTFIVSVIAARFEGVIDEDLTQMSGRWKQGGQSLPLVMERVDEAPVVSRPQEPTPPFPYRSEEIRFTNAEDSIQLAGTLTIPASDGPHPVVALVSGSGPQDRNETLMNHRPFLVIADYLTRRGIAVLRYDDRGVGESAGTFETATMEDFADDAQAAVAYLRSRPEVDSERVGLIGHSEGGIVAPMAALRSPDDVNFLVLLAAPALPGGEIVFLQNALMARVTGADSAAIDLGRHRLERIFAVLKAEPDLERAADRIVEMMRTMELTDEERQQLEAAGMEVEELIAQQIQLMNTRWFRYFISYDPAPALERLSIPVLALTGERDLQVPPDQNLPVMRQALEHSPSPAYEVRELAGLNHLFQSAGTGHPNEYARIEETFSPVALAMIGDWILDQGRSVE